MMMMLLLIVMVVVVTNIAYKKGVKGKSSKFYKCLAWLQVFKGGCIIMCEIAHMISGIFFILIVQQNMATIKTFAMISLTHIHTHPLILHGLLQGGNETNKCNYIFSRNYFYIMMLLLTQCIVYDFERKINNYINI